MCFKGDVTFLIYLKIQTGDYCLGSGTGGKTASLRAQILQDMEAERNKSAEQAGRYAGPREVNLTAAPVAGRVMFRSALTGPDLLLPREEMEAHIEAFLLSQLASEPAMTAALMIYTLNRSPDAVKQCVETIGKYLDNISQHPHEEKYRRIRASNKVLQERVLSLRGTEEFLQATGFRRMTVEIPDGAAEEFLVFEPGSAVDYDRLTDLREILQNAEPIRPELDRSIRVFHPSPNAMKMAVPDEFFRVSAEELRREQQAKKEAVEQLGMLRTREMRERDRMRELRRYRYCLIRVRFPDGVLLQGTFAASEKLSALFAFIADNLVSDWIPFGLSSSTGQSLTEDTSSLAELDLAPASLVNLTFDPSVMADIASAKGVKLQSPYIKSELMATICSL